MSEKIRKKACHRCGYNGDFLDNHLSKAHKKIRVLEARKKELEAQLAKPSDALWKHVWLNEYPIGDAMTLYWITSAPPIKGDCAYLLTRADTPPAKKEG